MGPRGASGLHPRQPSLPRPAGLVSAQLRQTPGGERGSWVIENRGGQEVFFLGPCQIPALGILCGSRCSPMELS